MCNKTSDISIILDAFRSFKETFLTGKNLRQKTGFDITIWKNYKSVVILITF